MTSGDEGFEDGGCVAQADFGTALGRDAFGVVVASEVEDVLSGGVTDGEEVVVWEGGDGGGDGRVVAWGGDGGLGSPELSLLGHTGLGFASLVASTAA